MARSVQTDVIVFARSQRAALGKLSIGGLTMPCALGQTGSVYRKREGDGGTPIGRWPIETIMFRPDRRYPRCRPQIAAAQPLRPDFGWCDAVGDRNYNRRINHPYDASAERLWRDDGLYDIIVVLGHNRRPRVQGHGSAIFLHAAKHDELGRLQPTAGCVALRKRGLLILLSRIRRSSRVRICV